MQLDRMRPSSSVTRTAARRPGSEPLDEGVHARDLARSIGRVAREQSFEIEAWPSTVRRL